MQNTEHFKILLLTRRNTIHKGGAQLMISLTSFKIGCSVVHVRILGYYKKFWKELITCKI
jgi:hypothetical protein